MLIAVGIVALGLVAALAWLSYTGLRARHELEAVRSEVHTLRADISAGDLDKARATANDLRKHASAAHDLTTGPIWAVAAAVPYLGDPLDTVRTATDSVDAIAQTALPALIDASVHLDPAKLRRADGSFDVATLASVAPLLTKATGVVDSAVADLSHASSDTWFSPVDTARSELLDQLVPLGKTVRNADVAARITPALLGADGPRKYLISFQNEAELRGTGGLPGAFAILKADHGKLSFVRFESDDVLANVPSGQQFGLDYKYLYPATAPSTDDYRQSTASPNFAYAAQIWLGEWQHVSGQRLDGAMTLDPTALSYLLGVTGPAQLANGDPVDAANVVALTQQTVYDKFTAKQNNQRKQYLLDIAKAVSEKFVDGTADTTGLVRAAARAAGEHRLLMWTSDKAAEALLSTTTLSGTVPVTTAPYAGLAINNAAGNKLDYYTHATLDRQSSGCGSTRDVTVTMTIVSRAPVARKLPAYVIGFTGLPGYEAKPGVNRDDLLYYATQGASLISATLNGQPTTMRSGRERGHPAFGKVLFLPRNQVQTLVLHLKEPGTSGAAITRMQPMINPLQFTQHTAACGA